MNKSNQQKKEAPSFDQVNQIVGNLAKDDGGR